MMNKLTQENYNNIRKRFESETGVHFVKKEASVGHRIPFRTVLVVGICLALACAGVFATEEGQELIHNLFFNRPVASDIISVGFEMPDGSNSSRLEQVSSDEAEEINSVSNAANAEENNTLGDSINTKETNSASHSTNEGAQKQESNSPLQLIDDRPVHKPGHRGIDFVCEPGTPVYPVLPGKIVETGFSSSAGNYIMIEHEESFTSRYHHLRDILVEPGQEVSEETQIGTVGSTGMSTGPHLHIEMTYRNELIDPSPYLLDSPMHNGE